MAYNAFKKLNVTESKQVIAALNDNSALSDFNPAQSVVMAQNLVFYPEYKLLHLADKTVFPEKNLYAVYKSPQAFKILDYTNTPIYEVNESCPIHLDSGTVTDYVRFFFEFVRGTQGRFIITETLDDIAWQDEPPLNARKAISKLLMPVTVIGNEGKSFKLKATYIFLDGLVQSDLYVDAQGRITMDNDEILIEDMPVIHEDFE